LILVPEKYVQHKVWEGAGGFLLSPSPKRIHKKETGEQK
jgi:hypothetical protein